MSSIKDFYVQTLLTVYVLRLFVKRLSHLAQVQVYQIVCFNCLDKNAKYFKTKYFQSLLSTHKSADLQHPHEEQGIDILHCCDVCKLIMPLAAERQCGVHWNEEEVGRGSIRTVPRLQKKRDPSTLFLVLTTSRARTGVPILQPVLVLTLKSATCLSIIQHALVLLAARQVDHGQLLDHETDFRTARTFGSHFVSHLIIFQCPPVNYQRYYTRTILFIPYVGVASRHLGANYARTDLGVNRKDFKNINLLLKYFAFLHKQLNHLLPIW